MSSSHNNIMLSERFLIPLANGKIQIDNFYLICRSSLLIPLANLFSVAYSLELNKFPGHKL